MKKFLLPSFIVLIIIISFFTIQVLSQRPDTKISVFNSSISLEEKGDYKAAIDEIVKVYNDHKDNFLFNLRLGWLYYNLKDYQNSKKFYTLAIEINKNSIEANIGITYPLAALNDWSNVQKQYSEVLKLDPNNYTANLRLGQIFLNKMEYNTAKKHLEKVQSAFTSYYEPNLSLGYTYYYLGNNKKAEELFINALMLSPNDSLATAGLKLVK
jgi:tetratricopeptide (TPR) repeat protein